MSTHYMANGETVDQFISRKETELFHAVIDRKRQVAIMNARDEREHPRPFGADRSSQKSH